MPTISKPVDSVHLKTRVVLPRVHTPAITFPSGVIVRGSQESKPGALSRLRMSAPCGHRTGVRLNGMPDHPTMRLPSLLTPTTSLSVCPGIFPRRTHPDRVVHSSDSV